MHTSRLLHVGLCWLYLVLPPLQVAFAGYGVMGGDIDLHEIFGGTVLHIIIPFLLLVSAAIGRLGWAQAGWSFGLFLIITLQIALVSIGRDMDATWVSGLHPAVAFLTWPYVYFVVLARAGQRIASGDTMSHAVPAA